MLEVANAVDMGQGAAMAIEGAVSLATLLPGGTKVKGIHPGAATSLREGTWAASRYGPGVYATERTG